MVPTHKRRLDAHFSSKHFQMTFSWPPESSATDTRQIRTCVADESERSRDSDAPSIGETSANTTTISGYLNGTLIKTLTENYVFGGGSLLTLNLDGVNDVKLATSNTRMVFGQPVIISNPDLTLISQLTVANSVAKVPEIDPATATSALTLLIGGLLVSTGRRLKCPAASA